MHMSAPLRVGLADVRAGLMSMRAQLDAGLPLLHNGVDDDPLCWATSRSGG
jgi:hypothetical protein